MAYNKRFDGRKFDEIREMEAKVGIIKRANGSAMFRIGKTIALAAVYGPRYASRDVYNRVMKNPNRGVLRCNYNMMAFSGSGDRVRPGPSRRSRELSLVIEKALTPLVNLEEFPGSVIDVFIELPQTDSGTRCAGIVAASMALADAGIKMKDLVTSVAVGKIADKIVIDVNKEEEDYEDGMADIAIAMSTETGEITLLQNDGMLKKEDLIEALNAAKKGCLEIKKLQIKALKECYK